MENNTIYYKETVASKLSLTTFTDFINSLINPSERVKQLITNLRTEYQIYGKTNNYKKGKLQLPLYYHNVSFKTLDNAQQENIKDFNNRLFFDIDNLTEEELNTFKQQLIKENFVEAVWTSVSGKGLQFTVKCLLGNNKLNNIIFNYFKFQVLKDYPLDTRCFSLSKASFGSFDTNVYYNPNCAYIHIPDDYTAKETKKLTKKDVELKEVNTNVVYSAVTITTKNEVIKQLQDDIDYATNNNIPFVRSQESFFKGFFYMQSKNIEKGSRNKYITHYCYFLFQKCIIEKTTTQEDINNICTTLIQANNKLVEPLQIDEVKRIYNHVLYKYNNNKIYMYNVKLGKYIFLDKNLDAEQKRKIALKNENMLKKDKSLEIIHNAVTKLIDKNKTVSYNNIINQAKENNNTISLTTVRRYKDYINSLKEVYTTDEHSTYITDENTMNTTDEHSKTEEVNKPVNEYEYNQTANNLYSNFKETYKDLIQKEDMSFFNDFQIITNF